MRYAATFRILRRDPELVPKLLLACLGLLLSSFVLPQVIVSGWVALFSRRVAAGEERLPPLRLDPDYLLHLLVLGFKGAIATVLFTLPLMVPLMLAAVIGYVVLAAVLVAWGPPAIALGLVFYLAIFLLFAVGQVYIQAAVIRVELTGRLESLKELSAIVAFAHRVFFPAVASSVAVFGIATMLSIAGLLACGLGTFPVAVVVLLLQGHVRGQLYRIDVERGGPSMTLGPLVFDGPVRP